MIKTSVLTIFVLCFLHTVDAVGKQVNFVRTQDVKVNFNEEADEEVIGDVDAEVIVVNEEPAAEEVAAEEAAAEEAAAEEAAAEEIAVEESAAEEPAAEEVAAEEPAAEEAAVEEPAAEEPAAEEPFVEEPAAEEPAAEEPFGEEPAAEEPAAEEPAAEEPAAEEPAAEEPAAEEPAAEEPAAEEPAAEEPFAEEPAAEEPAAEETSAEELNGYEAADASAEDADADVEEVVNCDLSNFIHCSVVEAVNEGRTDDMDKLLAIPTDLTFAMKLLPSESNFLVVNGMNNFDYESADYEDVVKALELGRSEIINTCIMHGEEGTTKLMGSEKISLLYTFLIDRVQMELKSGPNYMEGTRDESIKPGKPSTKDLRKAKKGKNWNKMAAIVASPRTLKHGWKLLPGSLRRKLSAAKKIEQYDVMDAKIDYYIEKSSKLVTKVQEKANIESIHGYHCSGNDELCFAINLLEFYKFYKQKQLEKYFETPTLPSCAAAEV